MKPAARVIKDSISPRGHRLITLVVVMHRWVLAEFNTHRLFSRSSASSRAIPVERQLGRIRESPAYPLEWASEQPGMQGGSELTGHELAEAMELWDDLMYHTLATIENYVADHEDKSTRLHKSLLSRLMEPFMWHEVIVSSTEWDNFFRQRVSRLAQPEIRVPAELMLQAIDLSKPRTLGYQSWHLPFIDEDEVEDVQLENLGYDPRAISAARVAQISFKNPETQEKDPAKDQERFERLVNPGEGPPHAAPFEMVARPARSGVWPQGNFNGWSQWRHELLGF
jgi:hypothetical protein